MKPQSNQLYHAASNLNLMTYNLEIKSPGNTKEFSLNVDKHIKDHHVIYGIAIRNFERYAKAKSGNFLVEDEHLMQSFLSIQNKNAQNQHVMMPLQMIFYASIEHVYWPLGGISMKLDGSSIKTHADIPDNRSFELVFYYYDPAICE